MPDKTDFKEGQLILIDKPLEWTSFQVVNKIRWAIRKKFGFKNIKVGHAGTLDPLATGLLILCTGKFTKKIVALQGQTKTYTGRIRLGATTASYDLEMPINGQFPFEHITEDMIGKVLPDFIGAIDQKPPAFSAIKKEGKRMYEMARKGETVEVTSRKIRVDEFEITRMALPDIDFRIVCGKGTYIRSLAHDLGRALDSGGHLTTLRRTAIGTYDVKNALSPKTYVNQLFGDE